MWWALFSIHLAGSGVFCFVNLVHDQGLSAKAVMGARPQNPAWSANTAIDGNTNQSYLSNSCAISNWDENKNTSVWWRVWLWRQFNLGYLEIYLRSDTYARSTGFSIYTYETQDFYPLYDSNKHLIYRHDPLSGCPSPIMNVTVNYAAQGLVFINERPAGYTSNCQGDNLQYTGVELCEVRVMGCDLSRYMPGCDRSCPAKCKNWKCDIFNGSCIYGCSDPNALTLDCIVCNNGTYVKDKTCTPCPGHCKDNVPCNKLTGRCDNGCENHWTGEYCQVCSPHYYGSYCNAPCGQCRGDDVCDSMTGHCPHGCKQHWEGPRCDVCPPKFYQGCSAPCDQCKGDGVCNNVTGYCLNGCKPRWTGLRCDECEHGFYNSSCSSTCGHCLNGEYCDKVSGHCLLGCQPHFHLPFCQVCKDSFYGSSCENNCGHCLNGESCDKRNGTCIKGCQSHFLYPLCKECKDGFYGVNCSDKCGQCDDNDVCDKRTGYCLMGCKTNLQPPFCKADPSELQSRSGTSMDEKNNVPETAFYVAFGITTLLLVLSIGVIIYQRRRITGLLQNRRQTDNTQTRNPVLPQDYANITHAGEKHEYTSLDTVKQESHYNVI